MRMSMPILRRLPRSGRCIGIGDISFDGCTGQCFSCKDDDDDVDELDKFAIEWIDDDDDGGGGGGFGCSNNSGILWPKLTCPCGEKIVEKKKRNQWC